MAKPDPALLDPARYPYQCEIPTRFGDLDVNQHVNNAAMVGLYEDARVRYHAASGYHAAMGAAGITAMVVSCALEYLGQGYYPEPMTFHVGAAELGRSSYLLLQLARQGSRTVGFSRATMVCVHDGKPTAIPDLFRDSVKPWMYRHD
ncbi:MAG: acyl-CoA thioesterase [Sphingomonadales bacterium]|nr:acyl-CoA thioesterase [Sphingomonadales bacterium]